MARSATKSGRRPQPDAQRKPPQARGRRAVQGAGGQPLFFERIRKNAKWVFVLLAFAFALSFVALGVGSGSAGLGDLLQGNFSGIFGGGGGPSVKKAQKEVAQHPNQAKGWKDLADAYQAKHDNDAAIPALERYVALRPKDVEQLQSLATLYQDRQTRLSQYASTLSSDTATLTPIGQLVLDPSSKLGQQFQSNDLTTALQQAASNRQQPIQQAYIEAQQKQLDALQRVVKAAPDDPSYLLDVAQAAQGQSNLAVEIAAYQQFLKKAPDDPNASVVRQQLKQALQQQKAQQAPPQPSVSPSQP
jgi:regulator of sirC expression with transglutaminase-like and TPR domain